MTQNIPRTEWKVLPHDPPAQIADNLWQVEGDLPDMPLRRRMVVARLQSGDLVIHNAVALDDAGMAWLEGLGRPAVLVVPNGWHRLDAARFAARYPGVRVVCPPGARKRVEKVVPVSATYADASRPDPDDDTVTFAVLDGMKGAEGVMRVLSADGVTLVLNDAVFNLPHGKGFFWFVYGRLLGNAGGPKVTTLTRWFLVKDKRAFRAHLERLADTPDLRRIVVAHGDIVDGDAAGVLRRVAAAL